MAKHQITLTISDTQLKVFTRTLKREGGMKVLDPLKALEHILKDDMKNIECYATYVAESDSPLPDKYIDMPLD